MDKVCSRCKVSKPLTAEFFHRCSKHSTGFKSDCKVCRNVINRKRQGSKKGEAPKVYKRNKITDYKKYRKEYYEKNKERYKKYYEDNKERLKAYAANYQSTEEYKIKRRIDARINKRKRDALKRSLLNTFTKDDWELCLKHFDNSCAYCGEREKILHQDHFIPVTKNGEHTRYNIVPACETCNIRKSDKNFKEWYSEQVFYDIEKEEKVLKYLNYKNDNQQIAIF